MPTSADQDYRTPSLVVFVGLQASGKTTFYRIVFGQRYRLISKDLLRNNRRPSRRQSQLLRQALEELVSIVIDNTNPTREERRGIIQMAREAGYRVIGYYFSSPIEECMERNQRREGKDRVPDIGLYATKKKLEEPCLTEGFDELYRVNVDSDSGFVCRAWQRGECDEIQEP